MRDHTNPRVFIFSAYKVGNSPHQNTIDTADLSADLALAGFPFEECEGSYKGVREESYIVTGVSAGPAVKCLARLHDQESYLVVAEHDRAAYVVDCETGYHTHVGTLTYHGTEEPTGDWTCVNGYYYHTVVKGALVDLPDGL